MSDAAPRRSWFAETYVLLTLFSGAFLLSAFLVGLTPRGHQAREALAIVSMLAGAYFAIQAAVESVKAREVDVNILMILAAIGAAAVHEYLDGAVLIFLFSLSNTLEKFTMARTREAIRGLLRLRPSTAWVRADGTDVEKAVELIQPGDLIVLRAGDLIPVDAVVVEGQGSVDEASMTGEPTPAYKSVGDTLLGGTLNLEGLLLARATHASKESTLSKVIALVEAAQSEKAGGERISHWVGKFYTWAVLAGFALFFLDQRFLHRLDFHHSFYNSVVLLVAASPCALVMATPASILSALAVCARKGILVRGGRFLETAARIKVVALDKTGTLTSGRFQVSSVFTYPSNGQAAADTLLRCAAAGEAMVHHPLAAGIVAEARRRDLSLPEVKNVSILPGLGLEAEVEGRRIRVGRDRMFEDGSLPVAVQDMLTNAAANGKTAVAVQCGEMSGAIALEDTIRDATRAALASIREAGVEKLVMLTGDNEATASAVAARTGVDEFLAGLMPGDKAAKLAELRACYGPVAMVGDGINDAPSLAASDLGIAMGGIGSDVALETADVVLMNDRIELIPTLFAISRRAMRIVRQNLVFACVSLLTLIFLTLTQGLPLPIAVVGHEMTTVLVMLNGVRLLATR